MKTPCKTCPFKKENEGFGLLSEKIEEILNAITKDAGFFCHNTLDYSLDSHTHRTSESKLCFGAALFLENTVRGGCRSNIAFRFGLVKREFSVDDLQKSEMVYDSFDDFREGAS